MNSRRMWILVSMAAGSLLLASCDTKNPLSDPAKAKPDTRLAGIWRSQTAQGGTAYCHIGRDANFPKGVYRGSYIDHRSDGTISRPLEFVVFPTTLGSRSYLNVGLFAEGKSQQLDQGKFKPEMIAVYVLLQYEFDGDALLVRGMNGEARKRAIAAGKLKGSTENLATVTDTSENLAAAVAANPDLFVKQATRYERVK